MAKRANALLAMAVVGCCGLMIGCDSRTASANRTVNNGLAKGAAEVVSSPEVAAGNLQSIANNQDASPALRIQAKTTLAAAQMAAANETIGQLNAKNVETFRLINEIELLAIRLSVGNTLEQGYRELNPQAIENGYKAKIEEAQGGSDKPAWFTDEKGGVSLPTLANVKQQIAKLKSDISKAQSAIDTQKQEQQKLMTAAVAQQEQADGMKGKDALSASAKASGMRRDASDMSAKIETAEAELVPLKHQLEIAQGQQDVVEQYIASVQTQGKTLREGWQNLQQSSQEQQKLSKSIVDGSGKIVDSIAAKTKELTTLLSDAKQLRDQADSQLTSAVENYAQAETIATTLCSDLRLRKGDADTKNSKFDSEVFKNFLDVYSANYFKVQQAIAENAQANLYASEAGTLAARRAVVMQLRKDLAVAHVKMPAGLDDSKIGAELVAARKQANETYSEAATKLSDVVEASMANDPRGNQARIARIYALYDWAKLRSEQGDVRGAKAHLDEAMAIRDAVLQNSPGVAITLPNELVILPKIAPPAPTTAPTAAAPAATAAADPATVAEVKKAISDIADAFVKQDVATIKSHINATPIQQPTVDVALSLVSGFKKFSDAMTTKFGPNAMETLASGSGMKISIPKPEEMQQQLQAGLNMMVITSTGADTVTVGMPGQPAVSAEANTATAGAPGRQQTLQQQTLPMKKVDGIWKIDLTALNPAVQMMIPMLGVKMQPAVQFVDTLGSDVEAGKYKSVDEVKAAIQKQIQLTFGGAGPNNFAGNPPPAPAAQ